MILASMLWSFVDMIVFIESLLKILTDEILPAYNKMDRTTTVNLVGNVKRTSTSSCHRYSPLLGRPKIPFHGLETGMLNKLGGVERHLRTSI